MGRLAPGQLPPAEDQRAADLLHPAHRGPGEHSSLDMFLFIYLLSAPERGVLGSAGRDQPAPAQPLPGVQEEDGAGLGGHPHHHLRGPVRRVGLVWSVNLVT